MKEQAIVDWLSGSAGKARGGVTLGIGDDAAIYQPTSGEELLFTTDFFIEGVHFRRADDPVSLGRRALARSLSDIAAMGGSPRFCLVSLALASWCDEKWAVNFFAGLMKLALETGTTLAGGDLSHTRQVVADVMVCGAAPKNKAIRRDGARAGDLLYVSGPLGGWKHKRVINPRLDLASPLRGKATACIDISDGIALDLHRLAKQSGVAATIDSLPLLPGASVKQALHDGEDYELLYTAPPKTRVPGIRIGRIKRGKPGDVTFEGKSLPPIGYDHFQHRS